MKRFVWAFVFCAGIAPPGDDDWPPVPASTRPKDLVDLGRATEVYRHGVRKEWGYSSSQQDTFVVVHPKTDRKNSPLYVVLHSAGHAVISCVNCTAQVGNHDIYRSPADFYALYLDCSANRGDWWWGGMHAQDADLTRKNSGGNPRPVERRVVDTVRWVIQKYDIDPNRVYLCGNSMGGSGTLGIGMQNGDLFAAIKANVPAGIEHVSQRLYFPPASIPENLKLPDPPLAIDYSAPNDTWSFGHDRWVKAMNDRKYALFFYWGPFGHANNSAAILSVNDLIDSFDWLSVRKNEAYPVFTQASTNNPIPWPDRLTDPKPGQVNAFFRWDKVAETESTLRISLFLASPGSLKTSFPIPKTSNADVTLRRIQKMKIRPGESFEWTFGAAKGTGKADGKGLMTIPGLSVVQEPTLLSVRR